MKRARTVLVWCGVLAIVASGCSLDKERAKKQYVARGDRYVKEKNYDAAIIEYRNAVQRDPKFGEAYRKLSSAYLMRGDAGEALRSALLAADLLGNVLEAQLDAGDLLLLAGRFDDARVRAQKALAVKPDNTRAHVLLANATAGLKDIDTAVKEFEEAIRLDPAQSGIYTGLAHLKASNGERDEAERIFKKAIDTDPKSPYARLGLAQFYWSTERAADAEQMLKAAFEVAPRDARVNLTLAVFYEATRRAEQAEPYLRTAADVSGDRRVALMLADYYIGRNRSQEAAKVLEPLSADRRWGALASLRLAGIAQLGGRADEALTIVDKALSAEPNNVMALVAKSDLLRQQNKLDDAVKAADAAVAAGPTSAQAKFVRGRVLMAKGKLDQAEQAFNDVLKLNPSAAAAKVELARLHMRDASDTAVAEATEATEADPRSIDAQLTLARALMHKRDYAKAQSVLDPLAKKAPNVAAVHAEIGTLLALKKDAAGARAAFTRAVELDPVQLEATGGLTALDFQAGRQQEALARVDALVAKAPHDVHALLLGAGAFASAKNFARAEALLITAIETDPASIDAYSLLGRLYLTQNKMDAARAQFEKIAARQEKPVAALTLIGTIDMFQNHTADAQKMFEKVIGIDPKAGVAANNLAWIYLENGGSVDLALHLAGVAKDAMPKAPEVHDTLGWAFFKKGSMPEAIAALQQSLELDPKAATTMYHLALAYEKTGDRSEARRMMTLYLQADPASERSAEIRRRLQGLGA
jgi:tetratricopeptide (TPR) repeat protein